MIRRRDDLESELNRVLVAELHQGLKDAIDAALMRGQPKTKILAFIRASVKRQADPGAGYLTLRAAELYLDGK